MNKQELKEYSYFGTHNHTEYSNERLKDCINKPKALLDKALELGLLGLAITDHETVSSHIEASRYLRENQDKFGDFKLGLGNEIYLVDKNTLKLKDSYDKIKYNHFILIAKNVHGHEFLRKQTCLA